MKDGVVLLIVGIIGVGGVLLWQAHVDPFHPAQYMTPAAELRPPSETNVPVAPKISPKPKRVSIVEAPPVVEAAPVPVEVPVAPAVPVVQHDPPPFPAVDQIASGAPEDDVTEKYGHPAISALTSANGHMLGTYVYARDGGRLATVIHLEDGKVASALSKSAPVPPPGVSIPRWRRTE